MSDVTRRRLLSSAALGAGGVLASSILPPALARAAAAGPLKGSLSDVKHVVIHMQENRSFDHYFGTLAGVRGFGDPNMLIQANGKSILYQQDPYNNPPGYLLPFHLDTLTTSAQAIPSTSHAWTYQHDSVDITVSSTPGEPTTALNDNWVPTHYISDGPNNYWYTMGYYEQQDIPFHFALAEAFTLCDAYHCSMLGPTWPNRMYLMTGMVDPLGTGGGPMISNVVPSAATGKPYTWMTYPERLTQAGISWRVYQEEDDYGTNPLKWFQNYQNASPGSPLYENALTVYPAGRFEFDAANGLLPTVSWILPTSGQSEHPAYLPAAGANFLASKLNAVASNRDLWSKTVFIVNYDENDGLFDHVVPPLPPSGTPAEFIDGLPIGGGVRVPCFVVSPWSVGGYVATQPFDHTSVLQFLEQVTGVQETNITAWRRQTFGDLTSALDFSGGAAATAPPLPPTINEFWQAETEVETLPATTMPTGAGTPPVQQTTRTAAARARASTNDKRAGGTEALPATASRFIENRTTHAADFKAGVSDKVYLGKIAAVENKDLKKNVVTSTAYAYVPGIVGGNVAIVNASTFALASAITSGFTNPYGVAATPNGAEVWVTDSGTNVVSVISTATNKVTGTVVVGIYPHGIAITPDGTKAFVANTGPNTGAGGSDTVSIIDVATQAVTATVDVGEGPQAVAISPDGSEAWVTCAAGVYVIATATGRVRRTPQLVMINPHGVAFTPSGSQVYVVESGLNRVAVLRAAEHGLVGHIPVGATPWNVAYSADGTHAYVTNANDNTVSVIDTATRKVTDTISLGASNGQVNQIPTAIGRDPSGNIWVACNVSSSLVIINTANNTVSESIEIGLGDGPTGIAFT
jgi:phospholipase C